MLAELSRGEKQSICMNALSVNLSALGQCIISRSIILWEINWGLLQYLQNKEQVKKIV